MLTHVDLFGGIGSFTLAAQNTQKIKTVEYCDICPDAQKVYKHHFPQVSIYSDICEYHPQKGIDIFTGGFPCTNISNAGDRSGLGGDHSKLWFEYLRCINEGRPRFVIIENPSAIIDRGLRAILGGLRMAGYRWDNPQILQSSMFGSPQKRERLFLVSYTNEQFRDDPTCWTKQIGEMVQRQRAIAKYPSFVKSDDGITVQFPEGLDAVSTGCDRGTKGRIKSRYLFGRTIDLNCAAIAIKRVLYLDNISKFH